MKHALVLVVALALVPARRAHADANSDGEQALVMMEEISTIVDTNKDNCDTMGDKLGAYMDKNAEKMKKLKAAGKTTSEEQRKAFLEKYKDRMKAMSEKMRAGLQKCAGNAKVSAAMKLANAK
jgi:hypothetical protein